jgi:anhydro-N-acetylmuramic acid kinase
MRTSLPKNLLAIGLMSGTSMDGVDAAIMRTDGRAALDVGPAITIPYDDALRAGIRANLGKETAPADLVGRITNAHTAAVRALLTASGFDAAQIDVVGFHGHTILHRPDRRQTVQVGDAQALADAVGIPVVFDFRAADIGAGGQGAPFAPLFHAVMADPLDRPLAVVNIGGVANATWIGAGFDVRSPNPDLTEIVAFDTGPGNALLDDWMILRTGRSFDPGGETALAGAPDLGLVDRLMEHGYFGVAPPKSLDRNAFHAEDLAGHSTEDGAATLAAFTARSILAAARHYPAPPGAWFVTGGGRHNAAMMTALADGAGVPVLPIEEAGWNGDALEAQAFAWLAVRSLEGLPLSLPATTGVPRPLTGGRLFRPKERATVER